MRIDSQGPYLDLNIDEAKQLVARDIPGYSHLKASFKDHYQEDVNLEQLRLTGVYDQLVSNVCGTDTYHIGPRGGRRSEFKIYFKDKENLANPVILDYQGQEELDYTIWTEDSVLVFEAKQRRTGGLDIGWHKLALPCYRFCNFDGLKVVPVYYLRRGGTAYLVVFNPINFQKDGILLNDVASFSRYKVFKANLSSS